MLSILILLTYFTNIHPKIRWVCPYRTSLMGVMANIILQLLKLGGLNVQSNYKTDNLLTLSDQTVQMGAQEHEGHLIRPFSLQAKQLLNPLFSE